MEITARDAFIVSHCRGVGPGPLWVWTETNLRASTAAELFATTLPSASVVTAIRATALFGLASQLHRLADPAQPPLRRMGDLEKQLILSQLLRHDRRFSRVRDLMTAEASLPGAGLALGGVHAFVDAVRLNQTTDRYLAGLVDEWGNAKPDKELLAELLLLSDAFSEAQRERCCVDYPGALDYLVQLLDLPRLRPEISDVLPQAILLLDPSFLFPVEQRLIRGLHEFAPVTITMDEDVVDSSNQTPSRRYLRPLRQFIERESIPVLPLPLVAPHRQALVNAVVDAGAAGEQRFAPEDVAVLACRTRETEVRAAVQQIRQWCEDGGNSGDIHLICLQLDRYIPALRLVQDEGLINWSIPRGESIADTIPARLLGSYLDWISDPSPATAHSFFASSQVRAGTDFASAWTLFSRQFPVELAKLGRSALFVEEGLEQRIVRAGNQLAGAVDVGHFYRFALRHEMAAASFKDDWVSGFLAALDLQVASFQAEADRAEPSSPAADFIARTVVTLALLYFEVSALSSAREASSLAGDVAKQFWERRRRLPRTLSEASKQTPEYRSRRRYVLASRAIFQRLRLLRATLGRELGNEQLTLGALRRTIEDTVLCGLAGDTASEAGVTVTEFLDSRSSFGRRVIVLGASSELVAGFLASQDSRGSELHDLARLIHSENPDLSRASEFNWLVGNLLRNSRELVFAYSGEAEPGVAVEASFVTTLVQCGVPLCTPPRLEGDGGSAAHLMVSNRRSSTFNEWDGSLGASWWSERESEIGYRSSGKHTYSPSALEMLADCPHLFFFSKVARVQSEEGTLVDELNAHVGDIVHETLSRLFRCEPFTKVALNRDTFSRAVELSREIADMVFQNSPVDWEWNSLFRTARQNVVLGLNSTSMAGRAGLIKGALRYLCELELGGPHQTEVSFGLGETIPALTIDTPHGVVRIVGRIDRLDFDSRTGLPVALWDYKTSRRRISPKAFEQGKSLQIPLYTAVVAQHFPAPSSFRAGILYLGDPTVPTELVQNEKEGVQQVVLATKEETVAAVDFLREASERVRSLDLLVREGSFSQKLDTEGCVYCAYREICARDESYLQLKSGTGVAVAATSLPIMASDVVPAVRRDRRYSDEQQAVLDVRRSFAVLASAGSGKTAVLEGRIMELLLAGAELRSILAITFTEKAALEIRLRLERALTTAIELRQYRGRELSASELECFVTARFALPDAPIGTIHSFAARLVRMDGVLAGWLSSASMLDEARRAALIERAVHAELLGTGPRCFNSELEHLLAHGVSFGQLEGFLRSLLGRPSVLAKLSHSPVSAGTGECELQGLLKSVYAIRAKRLSDLVQQELGPIVPPLREWIAGYEKLSAEERAIFSRAADLAEEMLAIARTGDAPFGELASFRAYIEQNVAVRKTRNKSNPRNFWFEMRDAANAIADTVGGWDESRERLGISLASSVIALATRASARYVAEKKRLQLADFDDLMTGAHQIICDEASPGARDRRARLLARIGNELRHFLVDEFQDTDDLQWEMIRAIAFTPSSKERTVFIVGDGKQAIYRFRGGDMRVFARASKEIEARGGGIAVLSDNYRSAPSIISFVNSLFEPLFLSDYSADGKARALSAVRPQLMRAKRAVGEGHGVQLLWTLHSSFATRLDAEAQHVASVTAEIVRGECAGVRSNLSASAHRGPQIAILTSTVAQLHRIASALLAQGVSFHRSHSSGFYDAEHIQQFLLLARALLSPRDELSLVGALRSPLVGLSDRQLLELQAQLCDGWPSFWSNTISVGGPIGQAQECMIRWRAIASRTLVSELLMRVAAERGVVGAYYDLGYGSEGLAIERFVESVRDAEMAGELRGGLAEFVQWFSERRAHGREAPTTGGATGGVVLNTIHGSKGLEYPIVILPFLDDRSQRSAHFRLGELVLSGASETLLSVSTPDADRAFRREYTGLGASLQEADETETRAEKRRLFYVACTRAVDNLILSVATKADISDEMEELSLLSPEQRRERIFSSSSPAEWLRLVGRIEGPGAAPEALHVQSAEGEMHLPVLSRWPRQS